jgi:hypothetical protein
MWLLDFIFGTQADDDDLQLEAIGDPIDIIKWVPVSDDDGNILFIEREETP